MVIPVDVFPDFIPLAGQADDILVDLFGGGFGIASFIEAWKRKSIKKMLEEPQSANTALDIICREYGFAMKELDQSAISQKPEAEG